MYQLVNDDKTVAVIAAGIGLLIQTYFCSVDDLREEHGAHLSDIAYSTDRNIDLLLKECTNALNRSVPYLAKAEQEFLESDCKERKNATSADSVAVVRDSRCIQNVGVSR